MTNGASKRVTILTADGLHGTFDHEIGTMKAIELTLDDGRKVVVPTETLSVQADGSYYLPIQIGTQNAVVETPEAAAPDNVVIPIVQEAIHIDKQMRETGRVRIDKVVREVEQVIDEPLLREQVEVEHVAINRQIEQPAQSRYEGDTLILPIMEEVLVVEKRLMLKEEVRITVRKTTVSEPQHVTVRQEEASIQRLPAIPASATATTPDNAI